MLPTPTQTATLWLPPTAAFVDPALRYVDTYAEGLGVESERRERLLRVSRDALALMRAANAGMGGERIGVNVFEARGELVVELRNRGIPITGGALAGAAHGLDSLGLENFGREGQSFRLGIRLGEAAARRALEATTAPDVDESLEGEPVLRELEPSEAQKLSQLFFRVYGYNYVNDFVYYPEKIEAMLKNRQLISVGALLPSGRIVGHVGLLRWGERPAVYEPCLGVVDPAMKSRGLFGKIFHQTMEHVQRIPMQYCFFDFVTNHEYSQRLVAKYHPIETALFVGCQNKSSQASLEKLGIGTDPKETDRYSLLFAVLPRVEHPFGEEIALPTGLGESLDFLLQDLRLSWYPASRFPQLPSCGEYRTMLQPAQSAVVFELENPGREALHRLVDEWRQLLKTDYRYAAVEIPLDTPSLGAVYDCLVREKFFLAGFVPFRHGDRLALRLQSIGPTRIAFDEIKLHTERARRLHALVRESYERITGS